jgi:hypothetical protein
VNGKKNSCYENGGSDESGEEETALIDSNQHNLPRPSTGDIKPGTLTSAGQRARMAMQEQCLYTRAMYVR